MQRPEHLDPRYRAALRLGAVLNAIMFFAEGGIGLWAGSAALIADAVDFLEDASMYGLAVAATGWPARKRAWAGIVMGAAMATVGLVALGEVARRFIAGGTPPGGAMAATALGALAVNVFCAWRLVPYRRGDASMRSVWLSTRNDAILNAVTIVAAIGVALTARPWPDILAGLVIAAVNLSAAAAVISQGASDLRLNRSGSQE